VNAISGVRLKRRANGENLNPKGHDNPVPSPRNGEGVTTIGSSPSTAAIDTPLEVRTNFIKYIL